MRRGQLTRAVTLLCEAVAHGTPHFDISPSTTDVIATTPVRMVGSGVGRNRLECSEGSGTPVALLLATRAASIAPSRNSTASGTRSAVMPPGG